MPASEWALRDRDATRLRRFDGTAAPTRLAPECAGCRENREESVHAPIPRPRHEAPQPRIRIEYALQARRQRMHRLAYDDPYARTGGYSPSPRHGPQNHGGFPA